MKTFLLMIAMVGFLASGAGVLRAASENPKVDHHENVLKKYQNTLGKYFIDAKNAKGEEFIPVATILLLLKEYLTGEAYQEYEKILNALYSDASLALFEKMHQGRRSHMIKTANLSILCLLTDVIEWEDDGQLKAEDLTKAQMAKLYANVAGIKGHQDHMEKVKKIDPKNPNVDYDSLVKFPENYIPDYLK